MEEVFGAFWSILSDWFVAFYHSKTFFVIKIFLAIYSAVLIVDVILLMYLGNMRRQLRRMRTGMDVVKTDKRKDQQEWTAIVQRTDSDDPSQYQAAILEGDRFVFNALEVQGYSGGTFAERLAQLSVGSFSSIDAVRDVHTLSNKIVHNQDITVTQEQVKNALGVYEKFLKNIDYL